MMDKVRLGAASLRRMYLSTAKRSNPWMMRQPFFIWLEDKQVR